MTKKYFIGKCGGKNCIFRQRLPSYEIPPVDKQCCFLTGTQVSSDTCENCPHGKTIDEMAQIGAKNLRDKPLAKIVIKALLGGEEQK